MSNNYEQIAILNDEYIKLTQLFLHLSQNDAPSEKLVELKIQIKALLEQIEALEKKEASDLPDKDLAH
jgi:hypothetical protein